MNHRLLRLALLVASLGSSVAAQQVWKVNCHGGPGVHFTDLPPAVAAAAPGDTILLYEQPPWCAQAYTATTISKALRIVGFNTSYPAGHPEPSFTGIDGVITITGIPAGQQVLLSNINMVHFAPLPSWPASGLVITHCDGDVLIEDLWFENGGFPNQQLRIENCANVVLRGCEFRLGGAPLQIINSSVLLTWTSVYHVPPAPPQLNPYTQTAEGLYLQQSTATLVDTLVWGSDVYGSGQMNARPGVVLDQATLLAGPGSIVEGGWLGGTTFRPSYSCAQPLSSVVRKDPRATMSVIPVSGPPPQPTDIHAAYHSWVIAGEPYRVSVAGPSNGFALLLLGDWMPTPIATPFGPLAVDPISACFVEVVFLPAPDGYLAWTLPCPSTAPNAHAFAFQALTLSPIGQLGLTVPSPLTVGWQHGRIP